MLKSPGKGRLTSIHCYCGITKEVMISLCENGYQFKNNCMHTLDEDVLYLLYSVRKATETSVLHYVVCYFKPLSPQEMIKIRIETYPIFQERDFYYFHLRTLTYGASITLLNFEKSNLNVHIEPYHLPRNLNKTTITDFSININQLILPNSGIFVSWEPNKVK